VASANIRECQQGRGIETPAGTVGVWLDTPVLDAIWGKGWYEKRFPHIFQRFYKYGIDTREVPILIYPTQHYQNGGILIGADGGCGVSGLYVAGEAAGGVHGRNRLGSNSLVDIFVFGRRAGMNAAAAARSGASGRVSLDHLDRYHRELAEAGVDWGRPSPALLPNYSGGSTGHRQTLGLEA
jgi:succinate dehydrogenase / fumarate reductase flavoprotein subunit